MFDLCVRILQELAALTGTTYEEINVILFCIVMPLIFAAIVARNVQLRRQLDEKRGEFSPLRLLSGIAVTTALLLTAAISLLAV
jgi:hypothetical protein